MTTDYTVTSLPPLVFGQAPSVTWARFAEACGGDEAPARLLSSLGWPDIETQLRNAMAEARGGEASRRPASGCSLYWRGRVLACFQEKDVLRRDELLDRVWWDAAGELTPPASPLGKGALATYAVRLGIALKRARIDAKSGNEAFDRLTAATRR